MEKSRENILDLIRAFWRVSEYKAKNFKSQQHSYSTSNTDYKILQIFGKLPLIKTLINCNTISFGTIKNKLLP